MYRRKCNARTKPIISHQKSALAARVLLQRAQVRKRCLRFDSCFCPNGPYLARVGASRLPARPPVPPVQNWPIQCRSQMSWVRPGPRDVLENGPSEGFLGLQNAPIPGGCFAEGIAATWMGRCPCTDFPSGEVVCVAWRRGG